MHTYDPAREWGMMPNVLHINTLKLRRAGGGLRVMGITLMDQPVVFPKYKEAWLTEMSMLVSQGPQQAELKHW